MSAHSAQIERAWHLLTVLLRLGHPARPADLAALSAFAPDLITLLCRIPRSPILLTDDGFVTVTDSAVAALVRFLSEAVTPPVPRVGITAAGERRGCSVMYSRKRKVPPGDDVAVPAAKRVLFMDDLEGIGLPTLGRSLPTEVHLIAGMLAKDGMAVAIQRMRHTASISDEDKTLFPLIHHSTGVPSSTRSSNHAGGTDESENPEDTIIYKELRELLLDNQDPLAVDVDDSMAKAIITEQFLLKRPIDETLLQNVTHSEDRCLEITTSMCPNHKLISAMPNILEPGNNLDATCSDSGNIINALAIVESAKEIGGTSPRNEGTSLNGHPLREKETSAPEDQTARKLPSPGVEFVADTTTSDQKDLRKSFKRLKTLETLAPTVGLSGSVGAFKDVRDAEPPKHGHVKRSLFAKQKKKNCIQNMPAKENTADVKPKDLKSRTEPKNLPNFESFTIEEEEGSGGYGTVYRARRKDDGKIFAIKYPHANAHPHHINNELRMLERYGGQNFVIKFEGSFKCGDSECFVLEHVEHDRPEVLKREMDILELRWYGYCLFRALAGLHKQGIVHRDVKPGNFLFSRKLNKGYLIDFNLANDLHQKFYKSSKSEMSSTSNDHSSLPSMKPYSYTHGRRRLNGGILDSAVKEAIDGVKKPPKNMKKRPTDGHGDPVHIIDHRNKYGSQAADGSGVTSAKDHTSTRTHSGDRMKQPIPCKGRKELINFVHETMQCPIQSAVMTAPVSQRKRVAAPVRKADKRLVMLTPMPLHSGGIAVAGAGLLRNKGKQKREGPCVGTKGFRAPEVLFRSYHQGCKVDIWSAGVTLLYLIIGRSPFVGDPEQNIKEIAKLRGSEALWEVAKLHNCESSLPAELLEVQSLQSVDLRQWCVLNSRKPEFLELVPPSLFDLVDKCLAVNPRCRITAEEALMHSFFDPCHESLRKQRLLRRRSESGKA